MLFRRPAKEELTASLEQAITDCKSYSPISLIQTDCKNLANILNRICQNQRKLSRHIKVRLTQFKTLNRFYWTPSRLHWLGLRSELRGNITPCSLGTPKDVWEQVHNCVKEITSNDWVLSKVLCAGDPSAGKDCDNAELIQTSIMGGRQILLRGWQMTEAPSGQEWFINHLELGKAASYQQLLDRKTDEWEDYIQNGENSISISLRINNVSFNICKFIFSMSC